MYNGDREGASPIKEHEIRIPRQKRSIEKKNAIIYAAYELFSSKGYYKTNTAEIAKAAGVSTGIVYNYFADKSDILLEVVNQYRVRLEEQFTAILERDFDRENLSDIVEELINSTLASHTRHVELHNELTALALLEPDIQRIFLQFEETVQDVLCEKLLSAGFPDNSLMAKIRIITGIIEKLSHDYIQHQAKKEDELEEMKELAISIIVSLLNDNIQTI